MTYYRKIPQELGVHKCTRGTFKRTQQNGCSGKITGALGSKKPNTTEKQTQQAALSRITPAVGREINKNVRESDSHHHLREQEAGRRGGYGLGPQRPQAREQRERHASFEIKILRRIRSKNQQTMLTLPRTNLIETGSSGPRDLADLRQGGLFSPCGRSTPKRAEQCSSSGPCSILANQSRPSALSLTHNAISFVNLCKAEHLHVHLSRLMSSV